MCSNQHVHRKQQRACVREAEVLPKPRVGWPGGCGAEPGHDASAKLRLNYEKLHAQTEGVRGVGGEHSETSVLTSGATATSNLTTLLPIASAAGYRACNVLDKITVGITWLPQPGQMRSWRPMTNRHVVNFAQAYATLDLWHAGAVATGECAAD